jgi:thermopsin
MVAGSFLFNNVTLGSNSSILAGIDSSGNLQLIVIRSSDLGVWASGGRVKELFSSTVGSGIYQINLTAGNYTVIFSASSNLHAAADAFGFRRGSGRIVYLNDSYDYKLVLQHYSSVNISVLADKNFQASPLAVNISGNSYTLNGDNVFDSLYNIDLDRGTYRITLTSSAPTEIFLLVSHSGSLINPLTGFVGNYSVGVASYGVYNNSGTLVPYQVSTDEVIGDANITALYARDFNTSDNNSAYGASLQLNVEMNTELGNASRVFWMQDVADFNTSQRSYYLVNNIWNNTLPGGDIGNDTLRGNGNVTLCESCGNQSFYAYSYPSGSLNYSLPLNIKLVILENQTVNGTVVSFGYQILQNGSGGLRPLVFFDRVLFPGYDNSTMLITPYFYTPSSNNESGNYYDAELVFGGESGGAQSYFDDLEARLWIYYYDGGVLRPFPSAYTFGQDTAETAANATVRALTDGRGGFATTGVLNPQEQIFVGKNINATAAYIQNSSRTTAAPTTTVRQQAATLPILGGGLNLSRQTIIQYLVLILIVVAVLMMIRLLLRRR